MFFGEFSVNLDANGRLAIPTRFRDVVASECDGELVLTYNPHERRSLWLYPMPEWEKVRDQVMSLSSFNEQHRKLQYLLVGSASHVSPDGNSRIVIPAALREQAGFEKKVVMMGLGSKFEIWNEEVLNATRFDSAPLADAEPSEEMASLRL